MIYSQNKDREEFEKKFKTIWVKSSGSQIGLNPAIGEECALVKLDEVWSYFQSYTQKKVEEAYKAGIKEVLRNVEYNAQTKIWEIPEEKLLSIQSKRKIK